ARVWAVTGARGPAACGGGGPAANAPAAAWAEGVWTFVVTTAPSSMAAMASEKKDASMRVRLFIENRSLRVRRRRSAVTRSASLFLRAPGPRRFPVDLHAVQGAFRTNGSLPPSCRPLLFRASPFSPVSYAKAA